MQQQQQQQQHHYLGLETSQSNQESKYYRILSAWSCAGIGTSIVIETSSSSNKRKSKSFRLVFDIGATPNFPDTIPAAHVLISHTHIDHIGAIFNHARAHSLVRGGNIPTYYVPLESVEKLRKALKAMSELDCSHSVYESDSSDSLINMNIIGVKAGEEFELELGNTVKENENSKERIYVRPFAVKHRNHPALGYTIIRKKICSNYDGKRGKELFREEFKNLSGKEIRDLVQNGANLKIDETVSSEECFDFAYTGDTSADGLLYDNEKLSEKISLSSLYQKQAFQSQSLIMELTFLESTEKQRNLAYQRGHIHVEDVIPILRQYDWFQSGVCDIYFVHISYRHKPACKALDLIIECFLQDLPSNSNELPTELVKLFRRAYVAIDAHLLPHHSNQHMNEEQVKKISRGGFINLWIWYRQTCECNQFDESIN